jgi:2-keto-3-deoxy-L-rhamnonate aldolase RhmA
MNAFRHLLKAAGSHPPIGTWLISANALVAEAMGHAGFDWAVVDTEHTPAGTMEVVQMLQALSATRLVPVVRVAWNDPVLVKRVLDAGAATVMFPYVQSAEEAQRAVASVRFPPEGVRGMAGMSRASRFGTVPGYLKTANQHVATIVQIETGAALEALEAIAAVDGVDALFIGPADLTGSLGHAGEFTHPEVVEAMSNAVQRAHDAGRPIGTLGGDPTQVAQYRAMGFDFVAVSSDLGLMMQAAQAALAALRTQEAGAHVHTLSGGTRRDAGY